MAHTYTPGLRVTEETLLKKSRILPIPGDVLVRLGDVVEAETVLARTELPGKVYTVNVVKTLGIVASETRSFMLKKAGDRVEQGETLAETRPIIKWFRTRVQSPIRGTVEHISEVTGQVLLREPSRPLEMKAYIRGTVTQIVPREGAIVACRCALVQGIFGIGGERVGPIAVLVKSPEEVLSPDQIKPEHRGQVIVGGCLIETAGLLKAREVGVCGIVVGGVHDLDLSRLLGFDLGVAITGTEEVGFSLIITEGFGRIPMATRTFGLLKKSAGLLASTNGSTQIRAGVVRPEVIIPLEGAGEGASGLGIPTQQGLSIGDTVRIIRAPHFGLLGRVKELPSEPTEIPTESKVRILVVEFPDGPQAIVPRSNVEILEK
jgi:biotin carboxyl carrier protein